jgi:1-acyl-sn-glycerol-3-phosphate acyltransferase
MRVLYSTVFWAFLASSSFALFPVAVGIWAVTAPFDPRKVVLHRFTCFWASLYSWLNPAWPVRIDGRERIDESEACVFVANHLSLLDILVLFRLFKHFKWVSKIENFRVPLIGWNMTLNRYIPLRRGDRTSVIQMMRECERTLLEGNSIMMFPEGTRSPTGRMRSFKPGAFELALKTGCPIQPLVIQGTSHALPKRGFILRGRHPISISVLERLSADSVGRLGRDGVDVLTDHVRNLIAAELDEKHLEPAETIRG